MRINIERCALHWNTICEPLCRTFLLAQARLWRGAGEHASSALREASFGVSCMPPADSGKSAPSQAHARRFRNSTRYKLRAPLLSSQTLTRYSDT